MLRKVLCVLAAMALVAMAMPVSAGTHLLVDINWVDYYHTVPPYESTAASFTDAGVTEDLTGAQVWNKLMLNLAHDSWVESYDPSPWNGVGSYPTPHEAGAHPTATPQHPTAMGSSAIELWTYNPANHAQQGDRDVPDYCFRGATSNTTGLNSVNPSYDLIADYLYLYGAGTGDPVDVKISGLAGLLAPNCDYKLYVWGAVGNAGYGQNSQFSADGGTTWLTTTDTAPVTFEFATGAVVDDDFWLGWQRSTSPWGAWNGFAFVDLGPADGGVVVPEPSALALLGLGVLALRRRRS